MNARTEELGLFPLGVILRRTLPIGFAGTLMLALIFGAWDLEPWSGIPIGRIIAFAAILVVLGMLGAALLEWESHRERRRWTVSVSEELISIAAEKGRAQAIPISSLQVVVAMASLTAWRDDLDIALFDHGDEQLASFPFVASGGQTFIE